MVEEFYNHVIVNRLSGALTQLLSAKQIIRDDHEKNFVTRTRELCQILSERLSDISRVLDPWALYVTQGSTGPISFIAEVTALKRGIVPFDRNVRALTSEIRSILTAEISRSKSKRAQDKQKEGDRFHGTSEWIGRSLATATQARDVLQKVDDATNAMWKLSNELGMGLMHYDSRPGHKPNTTNGDETEPDSVPTDPFLVSERLITMVSRKLSSEIIRLDNLAGPKQPGASN